MKRPISKQQPLGNGYLACVEVTIYLHSDIIKYVTIRQVIKGYLGLRRYGGISLFCYRNIPAQI